MSAWATEDRGLVSDLPLSSCVLGEVFAREMKDLKRRENNISQRGIEHIKTLSQNAGTTQPSNDALRIRLQTNKLAHYQESRRQRDIVVLAKLAELVLLDYQRDQQPEEKDPDYQIFWMFQSLKKTLVNVDVSVPAESRCSLEYALHSVEAQAIDLIAQSKRDVEQTAASVRKLQLQYGMEILDTSMLSASDRQQVLEMRNKQAPLLRGHDFIKSVEALKILARASEVMYTADKQDIAFSRGDENSIGKTLQRQADDGTLNQNTQMSIGYWVAIDQIMPSKAAAGIQAIRETLDRKSQSAAR